MPKKCLTKGLIRLIITVKVSQGQSGEDVFVGTELAPRHLMFTGVLDDSKRM